MANNVLSLARKIKAVGGPIAKPQTHLPSPASLSLPTAPTPGDMKQFGRVASVPLNTARATQSTMDWSGNRKANDLIPGYTDKPVAVRKETGEHLIYDGHHRTVSAMNDGKKHLDMHVIDAKHYDPANAGRKPQPSSMSDDDLLAALRPGKKDGGYSIHQPTLHVGPIHSGVAGRTDHLPMKVPSSSYVIPADIVGALGEGNTIAGFKRMRRMFSGNPYGGGETPYGGHGGPYGEPLKADGGEVDAGVPIVAAGGEYVLSPQEVQQAGDGDISLGHKVLDDFVNQYRAKTVKVLQKLPSPRVN